MSQLPPRHGPPAIVRLPVVYSRNEIDFETAKQNAREDELRRGSQLRFDQGVIRSASVDPGRSKPVQTQSSGSFRLFFLVHLFRFLVLPLVERKA